MELVWQRRGKLGIDCRGKETSINMPKEVDHPTGPTGPTNPSGPTAVGNARLASRVKDALMEKTRSAGVDVNARAVDGEVTLTGTVDVAAEKQAAADIARGVPGVRAVVDNITISTDGTITDGDIEKELTHTLVDEGLRGVGVELDHGEVTLVGRVRDVDEEQLALSRAAEVRGVKGVFSELSVGEPEGEDEIAVGGKPVDVGEIDVPERP